MVGLPVGREELEKETMMRSDYLLYSISLYQLLKECNKLLLLEGAACDMKSTDVAVHCTVPGLIHF